MPERIKAIIKLEVEQLSMNSNYFVNESFHNIFL